MDLCANTNSRSRNVRSFYYSMRKTRKALAAASKPFHLKYTPCHIALRAFSTRAFNKIINANESCSRRECFINSAQRSLTLHIKRRFSLIARRFRHGFVQYHFTTRAYSISWRARCISIICKREPLSGTRI